MREVDLDLKRDTLTVVTGRIGSGKTTLVRTLLGLLPAQAGTIAWNGRTVDDPAGFFVPPQSAYLGQSPRLFSQSLRDNVLLGQPARVFGADGPWPLDGQDRALWLAVMEEDAAVLRRGSTRRWGRAAYGCPAGRPNARRRPGHTRKTRNCLSSTTCPARWMS